MSSRSLHVYINSGWNRLKEEVIAQGIELQRRWIREVKVRVEQERGGRLAKLDELAAGLKRLERLALDNGTYLDENLRVHALWSALRALSHAVESPVRKPFREELRVLRHFAGARDDPAAAAALETLEATDVPDVGVEPLADLSSWFITSVAPRVESVALVPDQNAGLLAHLTSHLFSSFRFRRHGLVEGKDVLSIVARAECYLNEKDLDSATRELNQLKGTPKALLEDWLAAARRRLEILQALEVCVVFFFSHHMSSWLIFIHRLFKHKPRSLPFLSYNRSCIRARLLPLFGGLVSVRDGPSCSPITRLF